MNPLEEQKQQYLEFIQNVITRMNTNSFQLKELTILILTACLAIYASDKAVLMILIPLIPTIVLGYLDAYYLLQEKKFRALYDDVAGITDHPLNPVKIYKMSIEEYTSKKKSDLTMWNVIKSTTIASFYGSLVILLILIYIYIQYIIS